MDKAVILARGLGTRMRKADDDAVLTEEQKRIAAVGVKAMMPMGRPFLDYVISSLADAGCGRVCLVIGPEHDALRDYYSGLDCKRVKIDFAIQQEPLGTADAVAAAEGFAADDNFLVINSDNYYPPQAFAALKELDGPGLAGFERRTMLAGSNIEPERIAKFAIIEIGRDGMMKRILEKPTPEQLAAAKEPVCLSMNCWRFTKKIFEACRNIEPSARGELEIPDAVQYAIDRLGENFRVAVMMAAVLDMSSRKDVGPIARKLKGMEVSL
jgi:dTDP-glucose pyrophosphorylase